MAEIYYGKNYIRQVLGQDISIDDENVKSAVEEITGEKIKEVVNDAPEELDTFGEVANAIRTNSDSIGAINEDINRLEIKIAGMEASGGYDNDDWDAMTNTEINGLVGSIFENLI